MTDVAGYIFLPLFWAFVFFSLRKNSSRKKIWLAVALIYPAVLLVCFLITQMIFTDPLHCVLILIPYFVGIVLGNLFDTSKKWHWALVPILTLLTYSTVIFWKVYPPVFYPFAEIVDEPLQDVELKMGQNVDYEIEMIQEDAWWNDTRIIAVRECCSIPDDEWKVCLGVVAGGESADDYRGLVGVGTLDVVCRQQDDARIPVVAIDRHVHAPFLHR